MVKTKKETTARAKTCKCVRLDDLKGFKTKLNKTKFPNELMREIYYYSAKCYEQVMRDSSPTSVATIEKFHTFRSVSEGLKLKPLPEGFQSFSHKEKKQTMQNLVDKLFKQLAASMSRRPVQGVDIQADYPGDMQAGEGSGPDPASEGVPSTSLPPNDSSLQNVPLGSVRGEGLPGDPPGFSLDLGSCTSSKLDNPEGRPPPSSRQCPHELNQSMSDLECRASRYPDTLPEFGLLKQQYILFVNKLKDQEMNEPLSLAWRSNLLRRSPEEIPSRLPEDILAEDSQNQLSKASMEDGFQDVGFQGSYPASDFGVKNIDTPMSDGEGDGLLRNRSTSEALEVVPRLTGRLRKNVGDILPQVHGGSADGDLPSKLIMEGRSRQASDLQVRDLCSGGENFTIMPNPGGNNTLQVAIDRFVAAEPSADEQEQLAEWQRRQFDMPVLEDVDMQVNNPDQIQVEEAWAAPNPDLGNTLSNSFQNVAWNQWDNSQGWPPSRDPVPLEDLVLILSGLMHRASRFPGMLPKFEWSEGPFRSFVNHLEFLEFLEGILEDGSNTLSRSRLDEIYASLEDISA